jgi:hypothetical protein
MAPSDAAQPTPRRYPALSAFRSSSAPLVPRAYARPRNMRSVVDFSPRSSWLMYVGCSFNALVSDQRWCSDLCFAPVCLPSADIQNQDSSVSSLLSFW